MNFEEHAAKPLLATVGIAIPASQLVDDPDEAARAAQTLAPCVVKAQVPTGKRGKAGGIQFAADANAAKTHAQAILGMEIDGHRVQKVLIEAQVPIQTELYAAVLNDPQRRAPMVLFSTLGGMDLEEAAAQNPAAVRRISVDINRGLKREQVLTALAGLELGSATNSVAECLLQLYTAYRRYDAELLEINPLVLTTDERVIALDCKFTMDDAAAPRQQATAPLAAAEPLTALEAEAQAAGLKYIELEGPVGVLANGAGLTMTTMDAITHYGGAPANFLEIGGEAYTKATIALQILLKNRNIRSLLVNFCGAFARTDVMAEGVVKAWQQLNPDIPVFFVIHGTGADEAVALVKRELGIEPYDLMDDAVQAAIAASREATA